MDERWVMGQKIKTQQSTESTLHHCYHSVLLVAMSWCREEEIAKQSTISYLTYFTAIVTETSNAHHYQQCHLLANNNTTTTNTIKMSL